MQSFSPNPPSQPPNRTTRVCKQRRGERREGRWDRPITPYNSSAGALRSVRRGLFEKRFPFSLPGKTWPGARSPRAKGRRKARERLHPRARRECGLEPRAGQASSHGTRRPPLFFGVLRPTRRSRKHCPRLLRVPFRSSNFFHNLQSDSPWPAGFHGSRHKIRRCARSVHGKGMTGGGGNRVFTDGLDWEKLAQGSNSRSHPLATGFAEAWQVRKPVDRSRFHAPGKFSFRPSRRPDRGCENCSAPEDRGGLPSQKEEIGGGVPRPNCCVAQGETKGRRWAGMPFKSVARAEPSNI